ncbi:hypothetical protein TYRP_021804 [Tyrophagus putrescentiae]|nr:hypothetical protein TYRP_021804 [Tyrophagus putrescentiae]
MTSQDGSQGGLLSAGTTTNTTIAAAPFRTQQTIGDDGGDDHSDGQLATVVVAELPESGG